MMERLLSTSLLIPYIHLVFVVHQCNQVLHFVLICQYDMFQPHTAIFKCYSYRSWCSVMPFFLNMLGCQPCAPADGVFCQCQQEHVASTWLVP
jgi:hypothetical protein